MKLWRSLSGVLEVALTSAELPAALAAINKQGVELEALRWENELTCRFLVRRSQYPILQELAKKRGESLQIRGWKGLFWKLAAFRKRPVLVLGLLFFFCLTMLLPERVLFVRVEGNHSVPYRQILEAAEQTGVVFGASRRELRSERVKNVLLSQIPQLQWAGVNTAGCVATISVRERAAAEEEQPPFQVSRIVAATDGYILSGTVEQGTGHFQPGQTVRQGQLLISGYTQSDFAIRAARAKGEILAQTVHDFTVVTPDQCLVRTGRKQTKRKISLLIRKKRINLWKDSGISDATCGRMYEEYYITLPGGFRLPLALCVDTYSFQDIRTVKLDETEAGQSMAEFAKQYLLSRMVAGTIKDSRMRIEKQMGSYLLRGSCLCEEIIGREQPEQIGVTNGKND